MAKVIHMAKLRIKGQGTRIYLFSERNYNHMAKVVGNRERREIGAMNAISLPHHGNKLTDLDNRLV